jgi:DNA invertase Pin-like site-specific DNA recombinase
MRVKYNRISSLSQTGNRFSADTEKYDLTLMDKISGSVKFFERPKASELKGIIENYHKNTSTEPFTLVVEEYSRLGRNTGDLILTLEWMEKMEVNVVVRNLGLNPDQMERKIRFGALYLPSCPGSIPLSQRTSVREPKSEE